MMNGLEKIDQEKFTFRNVRTPVCSTKLIGLTSLHTLHNSLMELPPSGSDGFKRGLDQFMNIGMAVK